MNNLLKIVFSLSISGSILILTLFLFKPLLKTKISKRWQYYIWLVVIARLTLPLSPEASPVGSMVRNINYKVVQTFIQPDVKENTNQLYQTEIQKNVAEINFTPKFNTLTPADQNYGSILSIITENLWLIWLTGVLVLLTRKITTYQGFVRYIKTRCKEVSDVALLDLLASAGERIGVKKPVELYINPLTSSPLLIGFFHPCVVLPTTELSELDLQYTFIHEPTHYKHLDIFYKWLVQVTICLHWFNPLIYFMGREINHACELACDEAVIKDLDMESRRAYGDTLIHAIGAGGNYNGSLASVTLNESKELLKERLESIMYYKKASKIMIGMALILTMAFCIGATVSGAYTVPGKNPASDIVSPTSENNDIPRQSFIDTDSSRTVSLSANYCGIEIAKTDGEQVTFEFLGIDNPSLFKTKCEVVNGILKICVDGTAARDAADNSSKHYYVENGPNYVNVVRIGIPDKKYSAFSISLDGVPAVLPDLNAPVSIECVEGSVSLTDTEIYQGTYNIKNSSGSISIAADTISSNITVDSHGECELTFNQMPQNLYLDVSGSQGQVIIPDGWSRTQSMGNAAPIIRLSNHGFTRVTIKK
ncbi:M56 family metallopeptidase [Lutispora thermophila]|uniref:Signal transducer regulating beta-lactamase production, contains metallopeptidase domain n=1 Tax=Lutispora thermophila DSM 19022 TaxID=1122184 RepID=A0A1M6IKQ6_9FIRM|nr:M56 family metallopeptidase [Lutispora thermophila]SHJ35051.1 Signal transducer regulating beta-lactamase production, contains metallopeptidase domain [Lutispora thermophila DSM 19022]